jgi:hypothetical protein
VKDLLVSAVPGLRDCLLEENLRKEWRSIVGIEVARRSRPERLKAGVLSVTVDNSPWLQEMRLRSHELLAAITRRHGPVVTSLRIGLGRVDAGARRVSRERRPPTPAPLGSEDTRLVESLLAPVADPGLATSLRRILTKDLQARRRGGGPGRASTAASEGESS